MIKFLSKLWWCYIWNHHSWTSPIEEKKGWVDMEKVKREGIVKSVLDDAELYCKRCGHVSEVAIENRAKIEKSLAGKK